jgi:hypothetical protein
MQISAASQRRVPSRVFTGAEEIGRHVRAAIGRARANAEPWLHWQIADVLPPDVVRALAGLPLGPTIVEGPSGRREYRHKSRIYFDQPNMERFAPMREAAEAFQSAAVASAVYDAFGAPIDRTFLRIEYALDTPGFWLEPHTDIGVKKFTCFLYLHGADDLGTDIYADAQTLSHRLPFIPNTALAFIPGENTWHGFAPRPIRGVRRSVIINYVGEEWRARDELSFPDMPVRAAR